MVLVALASAVGGVTRQRGKGFTGAPAELCACVFPRQEKPTDLDEPGIDVRHLLHAELVLTGLRRAAICQRAERIRREATG
jgi:hypothetical protein